MICSSRYIFSAPLLTVILPQRQRTASLPNQRKRSLALGPVIGCLMRYLYISLSCSTWHNQCRRRVVFSTINIAVTVTTVPTSTSPGRTQHRQDNNTLIYEYQFETCIPDCWFFFFFCYPPELKHNSFPAEETQTYVQRELTWIFFFFALGVFTGNNHKPCEGQSAYILAFVSRLHKRVHDRNPMYDPSGHQLFTPSEND